MDIQTITNIQQILDLDPTCIIFDLETLIKGSTTLGSSEWCYQISAHNSVSDILDSLDKIYPLVHYTPVEESTIRVLLELKNRSIKQYFLSPRGMRHYSYILKQIRDSNLDSIILEDDIIFFEEMENSKQVSIKSIKPKVKDFVYVSRSIDDLRDVIDLKRNIKAVHYDLQIQYSKKDASRDNDTYNQIKMFEMHINKELSYMNCLNITLLLSMLWWWMFRFAGLYV